MLLVLAALPVQAAEPIPLQVIPYQARNQEIPVLPFLVPPPRLLLEPTKPKKRRRNSARDQAWEDDFDWLMDQSSTCSSCTVAARSRPPKEYE